MENKQKGLAAVFLVLIVIIILLGIIGYSYLRPTQQSINQQVPTVPATPETAQVKGNDPALVNTTPELLTYSGKTDISNTSFLLKYPSSWVYYKFSCNVDGVAFWPKNIAPDFSKGVACSMDSFLETAPIILYSTGQQPQLNLKNNSYQTTYNQMKSSLSF